MTRTFTCILMPCSLVTVYQHTARGPRQTADGKVLLFAKSRVVQWKKFPAPRLELTAPLLAVRSAKMLKACYAGRKWKTVFWTDYTIVLHEMCNVGTQFETKQAHGFPQIEQNKLVVVWRICLQCNRLLLPLSESTRKVINVTDGGQADKVLACGNGGRGL